MVHQRTGVTTEQVPSFVTHLTEIIVLISTPLQTTGTTFAGAATLGGGATVAAVGRGDVKLLAWVIGGQVHSNVQSLGGVCVMCDKGRAIE